MDNQNVHQKHKRSKVDVSEVLDDTIQQTNTIIDLGSSSLLELHNQKQQILHMTDDVDQLNQNLTLTGRMMAKIRYGQNKEKFMCIVIIILLGCTIIVLLYFRFQPTSTPSPTRSPISQ